MIGYVSQSPGDQLVMDEVFYELAFGLENMGLRASEIDRRIAETAHFFGIDQWIGEKVDTLSGGQKQILNLASTLILRPTVLLLDEPTAQLDPIAVEQFLALVERIRRETGTTILMSEHRLSNVLPLCSQVLHLERGALAFVGSPQMFCRTALDDDATFSTSIPPIPTFFWQLGGAFKDNLPLSVSDGRSALNESQEVTQGVEKRDVEREPHAERSVLLSVDDVSFRYEKSGVDVLVDLCYELPRGGIHAIVGGNGCGKSTLLRLIAGMINPRRGKIKRAVDCRIGMLPQDPRLVLTNETLSADLFEFSTSYTYSPDEVTMLAEELGLTPFLDRHPYDLSGGEMQRAALAKLLLLKPDVLLLDEPVKSLDDNTKNELGALFNTLSTIGKTILLVTHDLEFAATVAETTSLLFNRRMVSTEATRMFFLENAFYTTSLARLTRGTLLRLVTSADAKEFFCD